MIQLVKTQNGRNAKVLRTYPDFMTMEIAAEMLAENYRKELSEKNDNTVYIDNLENFKAAMLEDVEEEDREETIESLNNIEWEGPGYYLYGGCLLLDSTKSLTTIREDIYSWELVEVPDPVAEDDGDIPEETEE